MFFPHKTTFALKKTLYVRGIRQVRSPATSSPCLIIFYCIFSAFDQLAIHHTSSLYNLSSDPSLDLFICGYFVQVVNNNLSGYFVQVVNKNIILQLAMCIHI